MIVRGSGPPLVLVPGIQGRWEWMRPTVQALSASFTVATFSLIGERGTGVRLGPDTPFDRHLEQLDDVFERKGWSRAAVCGVSYGGLVAVRYAAVRPERVGALVLASAPGPRWQPNEHELRHVASPWATLPAFLAGIPGGLWPEIRAPFDGTSEALAAAARLLWMVMRAPTSPERIADRVKIVEGRDFVEEARAVRAPTLVITGERSLDKVVPVGGTLEYTELIGDSSAVTLPATGHLGLVTKPRAFAALVAGFPPARGRPSLPHGGMLPIEESKPR